MITDECDSSFISKQKNILFGKKNSFIKTKLSIWFGLANFDRIKLRKVIGSFGQKNHFNFKLNKLTDYGYSKDENFKNGTKKN